MEQITISKKAYDKMIAALTMIVIALDSAEDGKVSAEAIASALDASDFVEL